MDNASKALVMAGAILIAVMLISLGVLLFTRAQDIADNTSNQLDSLAVQTYNSGFTAYVGKNIKGTTVKELINKINSHNGNSREVELYGKIEYKGNATTLGSISNSAYYTVDVTNDDYYTDSGAIHYISISTTTN